MNITTTNNDATNVRSKIIAADRFLKACPIRYDCRNLFVYLIEMELNSSVDDDVNQSTTIETLLNYPTERDPNYFEDDSKLNEFLFNVKRFAFPYAKTLSNYNNSNRNVVVSSQLVQFYTFVFTDANRIRQYGFCRSAQGGKHILCMISYLPWYNVFISILNKISNIINEKETQSLYNFLEALYEYQLPEPGNFAQIFSHDGLDQLRFQCPDRRIIPSIQENRNLLKFFAFFDLDKLKKIFTALLLERSILVVSRDLENLTSCGLSFEYLIYPLEWVHSFVPIVPEHIDTLIFNQPFPFIYGVHTCIYEKLPKSQLENFIILLVDDRQILNADKDSLPQEIDEYLTRKLDYFNMNDQMASMNTNGANKSYDLLHTGPIKPFLDSVIRIIDDYREYIVLNETTDNKFKFDEELFYDLKKVTNESSSSKFQSSENKFYQEFRFTQAFQEFFSDREDYLTAERAFNNISQANFKMVSNSSNAAGTNAATVSLSSSSSSTSSTISSPNQQTFQKDFIESLFEQYKSDSSKLSNKIDKKFRNFKNKAKEKSSNLKTNLIKTRNQFIKKSTSFDNELKSKTTTNSKLVNKQQLEQQKQLDTNNLNKQKSNTDDSFTSSLSSNNSKLTYIIENDINNNKNNNENLSLSTSESSTGSSSSSSSRSSIFEENSNIKESIRIFAEASSKFETLNLENAAKQRITIDLSNDPEIKKYFDDNFGNDFQDESKETSSQQTANLIDISDDKPEPVSNSSLAPTTINTNPIINLNINPISPIKPLVLSPVSNQANNSHESILNEFDPFSPNTETINTQTTQQDPFSSKQQQQQQQPPKYSINMSNFTPKPFQAPNYNILIPPAQIRPVSKPANQIINQTTPNNPIRPVNPFVPQPFNNNFNQSTGYRPVNFNFNNKMNNSASMPFNNPTNFNLTSSISSQLFDTTQISSQPTTSYQQKSSANTTATPFRSNFTNNFSYLNNNQKKD